MSVLVVYVSAHGFGHWAQTAPVLKQMQLLRPELSIIVCSALPKEVLSSFDSLQCEFISKPVDIGMKQKDALNEDLQATHEAITAFHADWDDRVEDEAKFLIDYDASLVLSNISPLGFAAAKVAGVQSVGMGCLDWYEIYKDFINEGDFALQQISEAYSQCDVMLKLPLGMPTPLFKNQVNISPVKRRSNFSRSTTRQCLHLSDTAKVALVLFGGAGMPPFDMNALAEITDWFFLFPQARLPDFQLPTNVRGFCTEQCLVIDVMEASSLVVGKPGYGLLSEVWSTSTPFAYVPREGFSEFTFQKEWLSAHAPSAELARSQFVTGSWHDALEAAMGSDNSYPSFPTGGCEEAAALILKYIDHGVPNG